MTALIKSEIRKLFTVRSTYILMAFALALIIFFAFYFEGWRGLSGSPASELAPTALQEITASGAGLGALFASIVAILFMAHEYRYNTIAYTLTFTARRTKVLFAKLLVGGVWATVFGLLAVGVAVGSYYAGLAIRDASLPAQDFDPWAQLGKVVFYYVGYALLGMLIAAIVRGVVGAIVSLLLYSIAVEPLLSVFLKGNAKYLPINALDSTVGASQIPETLSAVAAVGVSSVYLAAGMLIAWVLFVRRDAM